MLRGMTDVAGGAREPCPCGSGRRYKACHGRTERAGHRANDIVTRPFAGLTDECDWVALREIVPAATVPLKLRDRAADAAPITAATVLPLGWPAMVRTDGSVYVGLQSAPRSGDISRDLAAALVEALESSPGSSVTADAVPGPGPRLQDLLDESPLEITVRSGFEFWGADMPDPDGELAASLERASAAVVPTVRLTSVAAAYWCRIGARTHLRWVLPDAEEPLLDGLARLHAARDLGVGDGSRYLGAFRADGLVVPVWDLAPDAEAADVEEPATALRRKLDDALANPQALSAAERRSRSGLLSRQVTLR
ncbi:MAG: hypothetical protein QOG80_675 [Pseudonocardiales bacterium]|jgi:hypothetical protein|nr:hypothetical protein [Pseudonocardiales bacterium]